MFEVLLEVWEPSIDEVEPADPWSIKDDEVDHLTRSGRVYKPGNLSGQNPVAKIMVEEGNASKREPKEDRVLK